MRAFLTLFVLLTVYRRETESFVVSTVYNSIQRNHLRTYYGNHDIHQPSNRNSTSAESSSPTMPSETFRKMAQSQLDLLASSLLSRDGPTRMLESIALYLPKENTNTGELEFTPLVMHPDPMTERVFIASRVGSGQAPALPKTLTRLPGFSRASDLLPAYPMMTSDEDSPRVGAVDEVIWDVHDNTKATALSVLLLSGSQTVGLLLVSPSTGSESKERGQWSEYDRQKVSSAAQTLSMALELDYESTHIHSQHEAFQRSLSDNLHQVKNPLQALRTYGKILQRQIAESEDLRDFPQLTELADRVMVQSERVTDMMEPMDALVESLNRLSRPALTSRISETIDCQAIVLRDQLAEEQGEWDSEALKRRKEISAGDDVSTQRISAGQAGWPTRPGLSTVETSTNPQAYESSILGEEGDLDLQMTFVAETLEDILADYKAIATERGIMFEVKEEAKELPGVMATPKLLEQAVSNIVENAIKYVVLGKQYSSEMTNPSPCVRIRMFANNSTPGVTLLVEDNGPGVPEVDRERIFGRKYRGEWTKTVPGKGLGLDIARLSLERMGGTLTVASPGEFDDTLSGGVFKLSLFRRPQV